MRSINRCRQGRERMRRIALQLVIGSLVYLPAFSAANADEGHASLQRIAFGSCAEQQKSQPIWDAADLLVPENQTRYFSRQIGTNTQEP